jgi:predicted O-methyltransferase YrrM
MPIPEDIPYPKVDFTCGTDPIWTIVTAPEFAQVAELFAADPYWRNSLMTFAALSLLYVMVRNQHPDHVVEIGTYEGRTTQVLARALHSNGHGTIHTVGPYDSERFLPLFAQWPKPAQRHLAFYPMNSMEFFTEAKRAGLQFELVFIDGNHDFEFALFDLLSAARMISPGGFVVLDNVSQAGPAFAAVDFLERNPEWQVCGGEPIGRLGLRGFDMTRANVPATDFFILRAPRTHLVKSRPGTFRPTQWQKRSLSGVRIALTGEGGEGTLCAQCIVRTFNPGPASEVAVDRKIDIDARSTSEVTVSFDTTMQIPEYQKCTIEIWLAWDGQASLTLAAPPTPF